MTTEQSLAKMAARFLTSAYGSVDEAIAALEQGLADGDNSVAQAGAMAANESFKKMSIAAVANPTAMAQLVYGSL